MAKSDVDLAEEWIATLPVSLWSRVFATDDTRPAAEWFTSQIEAFEAWIEKEHG